MNTYTKAERLTALLLLKTARDSAQGYANPCDQKVATEAVLLLAAEYARDGADLSIVDELTYQREQINATELLMPKYLNLRSN